MSSLQALCATCKHWDVDARSEMCDPTSHGRCRAVRAIDISTDTLTANQLVAFIPADFDYMPLMTRSDFGCVKHEEM